MATGKLQSRLLCLPQSSPRTNRPSRLEWLLSEEGEFFSACIRIGPRWTAAHCRVGGIIASISLKQKLGFTNFTVSLGRSPVPNIL